MSLVLNSSVQLIYNITSFSVNVSGREMRINFDIGHSALGDFVKTGSDAVILNGLDFLVPDVLGAYAYLKPILYAKVMEKKGLVGVVE